jgi:hypothetical protein
MLFSDPVRDNPENPTAMLSRQCALCTHACLEFEWLCTCCRQIDRHAAQLCGTDTREAYTQRPLLPPHWPAHARVRLVVTVENT